MAISQNTIRGVIINKETSEAITGAAVYFPELEKGTYTDKDGKFEINNLPKGDFTIKISYIGFKTFIEKVLLKTNSSIELNVKLQTINYEANAAIITAAGYTSQHHYAIQIESVDAKGIANNGDLNIMDKMDKVPGVSMISRGPGISTPNIRGLSLSNVLVLSDGFRINNYQFSENHPYLVSNYGISKVEIIKGPASLLYGSDAVGGAINFIGEKSAPIGTLQADVNTDYFSNTNGYQTNVGVKAHGKNIFWGVRAGMQQHQDYKDGGGNIVKNSRFNDKNISLNTGINNKYGTFKFSYIYKTSKIGLVNGASKLLVKDNDYTNDYFYQHLDFHMLKSQNKIYLGKTKLAVNLSYQNNRRRLFEDDEYHVDMTLQTINYEVKASRSLNANSKNDDSKIIFGFQGAYTENKLGDAHEEIVPNYYQNDASLFALLQKDIGKKLHFQLGGRYDYRNINVPSYSNIEYSGLSSIDTNYNNVSYTLGSTYEINHSLFLRLNLASAFRTANIAELTQDGGHGVRYERGNPNLKSQKSNEIDLGLHYHISNFSMDIAGFYNIIDNYIFLSPSSDTTDSGQQIFKYGQTNSTLYGFEAGFTYVPVKTIELRANYSFTKGVQESGEYLPFIPQNKINANVKYKFINRKHIKNSFVELSGTYAFSKDDISPDEVNSNSYFVLNANASTEIVINKQKIRIGIYATNILDTKYMDHLSIIRDQGYYNMGRNIGLKLTIPIETKI